MRFAPYLARRLLQLIGVLAGICAVTFLLLHRERGDRARLLGGERVPAAPIAAIRKR